MHSITSSSEFYKKGRLLKVILPISVLSIIIISKVNLILFHGHFYNWIPLGGKLLHRLWWAVISLHRMFDSYDVSCLGNSHGILYTFLVFVI